MWKVIAVSGAALTAGYVIGEALAGTRADRLGAMALAGFFATATLSLLFTSWRSRDPGS